MSALFWIIFWLTFWIIFLIIFWSTFRSTFWSTFLEHFLEPFSEHFPEHLSEHFLEHFFGSIFGTIFWIIIFLDPFSETFRERWWEHSWAHYSCIHPGSAVSWRTLPPAKKTPAPARAQNMRFSGNSHILRVLVGEQRFLTGFWSRSRPPRSPGRPPGRHRGFGPAHRARAPTAPARIPPPVRRPAAAGNRHANRRRLFKKYRSEKKPVGR